MQIIKPLIASAFLALTINATAQSILTEQPDPAEQRAAQLVTGIQGAKRSMLGELRHNISTVWDAPDPQAVISALGTKAGEAFWLSQQFAIFLQSIMTAGNDTVGLAELSAILAKVQPVTVNEDGTVTVNPTPTPAP